MGTSDYIALCSLVVSIGALFYSWITDKRLKKQQMQINEQQLAKNAEEDNEKKQAIIEANVYKSDKIWKVKIYNKGKACARNIRFFSDDIENDNCIQLLVSKEQFPYLILYPQNSFELNLMLCVGHKKTPKIKFIWDDDFGKDREREQVLNL